MSMIYPTGRKYLLNVGPKVSMANSLNFNPANYTIPKNLPMMAYITNIQKSNSLIFNSVNLTIMGKVAKLNSVYIFIL